jgi:hypothetical protein
MGRKVSKIDELVKALSDIKEKLAKDALDDKIKAKMKAEMDKRNFGDKQVADHLRDTDESIPAVQRSNIKNSLKVQNAPKPKLTIVKGEECYKISDLGQWGIEKYDDKDKDND